jgi:hypothetical protein
MKNKTAMMEAMSHLCIWVDSGLSLDKWIENYKDSYLEKEKEQIIDAYEYGCHNGNLDGAVEWYNQNYINEKTDDK